MLYSSLVTLLVTTPTPLQIRNTWTFSQFFQGPSPFEGTDHERGNSQQKTEAEGHKPPWLGQIREPSAFDSPATAVFGRLILIIDFWRGASRGTSCHGSMDRGAQCATAPYHPTQPIRLNCTSCYASIVPVTVFRQKDGTKYG